MPARSGPARSSAVMGVVWQLMCDENHQWSVEAPEGVDLRAAENLFCPEGHEAVTCSAEPPADRVVVTLLPQARVADAARGTVTDADQVSVRVVGLSGAERLVGPWPIDKAISWARELISCSEVEAWRKLDRLRRGASPADES